MSPLAEFLQPLLHEGRAVLRAAPSGPGGRQEVARLLHDAYAEHCLSVAGSPPPFDLETAHAAAALLHQACWALVNHGQPVTELEHVLTMPRAPATPSQHLSADLLLRFLPLVHRRARGLNPADQLTDLLARVLRTWPLSGVLSGVEDGPLTAPDFDGHPGLQMLYAERWCETSKPAWLPGGRGYEYVELAWCELGRDRAALPSAHEVQTADLLNEGGHANE